MTSTMQPRLNSTTTKVLVTNVTLSKGQASVDQATSSNATLTTVTPLLTTTTSPQPPMSSVSLVYQYFALLSYFMGQSILFPFLFGRVIYG